jgi:hypothetical protein
LVHEEERTVVRRREVRLVAMFSTGWGWHLPIWTAVGFLTCAAVQWHAGRWHTVYP